MTWIVTWKRWYMNRYGDPGLEDRHMEFYSQTEAESFASKLRNDKGPYGRAWAPHNIEVKKLKYTR